MATNVAGGYAHRYTPMSHGAKRVTVNFDDPQATTGVFVARLPQGAQVITNAFKINTVFNAGSTNVLTAGYGASLNEFVASGDVTATTAGWTNPDRAMEVVLTAERDIYAKYAQTGTAGTQGSAEYILTWIY